MGCSHSKEAAPPYPLQQPYPHEQQPPSVQQPQWQQQMQMQPGYAAVPPPGTPPPAAPPPGVNGDRDEVATGVKQREARMEIGEKFVISYDIGTTGSGAAFLYRSVAGEVGEPNILDKWPDGASSFKVPSVLLYSLNPHGRPKLLDTWGATCNLPQWNEGKLMRENIKRVEWFKLHIAPGTVSQEHMSKPHRQLPDGISAFEVYGDYLGKLHHSAMENIKIARGADWINNLVKNQKVHYVLTIPVAWQKPEILNGLRTQAFRCGLISDLESRNLEFCTEPEASALYCYETMKKEAQPFRVKDIFTVVDAGGGTIDLTSYQVLAVSPHLEMKEVDIGVDRCLFHGGTFIDESFYYILVDYLQANFYGQFQDHHIAAGMKVFKDTIKLDFNLENRSSTIYLQIGSPHEFDQGVVELPWELVEQAFVPHVDPIVKAAQAHQTSREGKSKVIFAAGGMGSSQYLRSKLIQGSQGTSVIQPEDRHGGSKAVVLGACRFGIYKSIRTRISPAFFGVKTKRDLRLGEEADYDPQRIVEIGRRGQKIVTNNFSCLLHYGEEIDDDQWCASDFEIALEDFSGKTGTTVEFYESRETMLPRVIHTPGVRKLFDVEVTIPQGFPPGRREQSMKDGQMFSVYDIQVLLSFGRAEIQARCKIGGQVAGSARIIVA